MYRYYFEQTRFSNLRSRKYAYLCTNARSKSKKLSEKKENTQVKYRRLKNLLYYRLKVLLFVTSHLGIFPMCCLLLTPAVDTRMHFKTPDWLVCCVSRWNATRVPMKGSPIHPTDTRRCTISCTIHQHMEKLWVYWWESHREKNSDIHPSIREGLESCYVVLAKNLQHTKY